MARPCVIVPLYIYPLKKAWEPLFQATRAYPRMQFLVIINPNSGPGKDTMPDASYKIALQELSRVPNVQPIGYVHCSYGQRATEDIQKEIDTYRGWNHEFKLEGIFVDEAPSDTAMVPYMTSLANHVHSSWSALGKRGIVIYNPGVVVDSGFFDDADYVVTFEQSWDHWKKLQSPDPGVRQLAPHLFPKALVIIHTFSNRGGDLDHVIEDIRSMIFGGLYITEQEGGGFTRWPRAWDRYVAALDDRLNHR